MAEDLPPPVPPEFPPEPGWKLSRRTFLKLGATAAAVTGAAYWSQHGGPKDLGRRIGRLDDWWHSLRQGHSRLPAAHPIPDTREVREYTAHLVAHPLRHLRPDEIIRPHFKKRGEVLCGLPPRALWDNLLPTLRVADELRERLDLPLQLIISAYRSPQYNAKCPGASTRSQHLHNRALDLVFDCPAEDAFAMAKTLREEGLFTGGLGLYESFIHIDTRGRNATWGV